MTHRNSSTLDLLTTAPGRLHRRWHTDSVVVPAVDHADRCAQRFHTGATSDVPPGGRFNTR